MKKIVALVLTLVLALSLATVAFGADPVYSLRGSINAGNEYYSGYSLSSVNQTGTHTVDGVTTYQFNYWLATKSGEANHYFVETVEKCADFRLMKDGAFLAWVMEVDANSAAGFYQAGKAYTGEGSGCTAVTIASGKAVYSYDETKTTTGYITAGHYEGGDKVLYVDGKIVVGHYVSSDFTVGTHDFTSAKAAIVTDAKGKVTGVTCGVCSNTYAFATSIPAGYEDDYLPLTVQLNATGLAGYVYGLEGAATTVAAGTTAGVTSAKTFDAGVALYAGMALMSVAGSAVVIGKKKEF